MAVSNTSGEKLMNRTLLLMSLITMLLAPRGLNGQFVEARFYPEKPVYLVGEPIFILLDLHNTRASPVFIGLSCAWLDTRFEAPTAAKPLPTIDLFGCGVGGWAGDCAGSIKELLPGQHYYHRFLLNGDFRLDRPGRYPIRAWHKVDFYKTDTSFKVIATQDVVSNFEVTVIKGNKENLEAAYQPLLRDLHGSDDAARLLALEAVMQNPPRFLENVILAIANDPNRAGASIKGLEKLATPRAKATLAQLAGPRSPECTRQAATQALGEMGDPAYCSVMLRIAHESHKYSRFIALRAAGYLCGAKAIPLARNFLATPAPSAWAEAAYALGNSHSRDAIPILIPLLRNGDPNVRLAAWHALATLTHRTTTVGVRSDTAAEETYDEWVKWCKSHCPGAKVYNLGHCSAATPLE
jgi:HEAT repeats